MKIAFVYDVLFPYVIGGVQLRNWELARRLARRGHEVTLFGMRHWTGDSVITREDVRLIGVCPAKELYAGERRAMWPPITYASHLLRPLASEYFDIMDVSNFPYFPCFSTKLAALRRRSTLVMTWIEVWDAYWMNYLGRAGILARLLERATARITDRSVAISSMTYRNLRSIGYQHPISVIPCGVDNARIELVPPSHEGVDVLFVGRLIREKNVDLLVRAMAHVVQRRPATTCLIVGDGPQRSEIQTLIASAGLQRSVHLRPFIQEHDGVFSLMKSSKVFVLPSSREGFGIVALEANACGIPVVTLRSERNAAADLITPYHNGFSCDASEFDLAEKIEAAISPSSSMKTDCLATARRHDWSEITTSLEHYYMGHS